MKKVRDYITIDWKKVICIILDLILYVGLYVATLFVYIKHYSVTTQENYDILTIIWNELANVATIAPVFGAIFINVLILKIRPQIPRTLRMFWSIMEVGLILFYRVAIAIEMHRVIIALVGLVVYPVSNKTLRRWGNKVYFSKTDWRMEKCTLFCYADRWGRAGIENHGAKRG